MDGTDAKVFLSREASDTLYEVLVVLPLSREDLPKGWDHFEGVSIIDLLQRLIGQVTELKAEETPARCKDSMSFTENSVNVGAIPYAKGYCVGCEARYLRNLKAISPVPPAMSSSFVPGVGPSSSMKASFHNR
uniref:Uncharacterized protein n=1 Tax=Lutzomyia longipalpis TaxID=7200 RepID=A0A1B0CCT4_LUTLO